MYKYYNLNNLFMIGGMTGAEKEDYNNQRTHELEEQQQQKKEEARPAHDPNDMGRWNAADKAMYVRAAEDPQLTYARVLQETVGQQQYQALRILLYIFNI